VACFLGEAQLMKYVALEPDDEAARQYVTEKCGKASFPALEYEPGFLLQFFLFFFILFDVSHGRSFCVLRTKQAK
jgi:hypothetical protein